MSLVNFLLLSDCTLDKDILPGDKMKLRVYIYRPTERRIRPQGYRQTILNMLNFLCPSGEIGQRCNNNYVGPQNGTYTHMSATIWSLDSATNVYRSVAGFILFHCPVE